MNELFKLLDNNEILRVRGDVPVDESVTKFINIVFRLGLDSNSSQKAYHEDVVRLLKSTELYSYVTDRIGDAYLRQGRTLIPDNYWPEVLVRLVNSRDILSDFFFFYGGIFSSKGERELLEKLREIWENHRNLAYRLGAILVIHLIGMRHIKDNVC